MLFRTSALAIAALAGAALPAHAQRFEYAPGTSQYRLTVQSDGVAEQGGTKQDVKYETAQRMTLTLARRAADTLALTITLDSITGKMPNGAPLNGSSMLGVKLNAAVSPLGHLYARQGVTGPGVQMLGDFADELFRFLPAVPESLGVGVTWSDTVSTPITQMGTQLKRSIVTSYRVVGDTTLNGESAWRIQRTASATVTGTGNAMGQSIEFETNGTGSGTLYLGRAGRYLGADYRDDLVSKATVGPQKLTITNTQTQTTKIALLR